MAHCAHIIQNNKKAHHELKDTIKYLHEMLRYVSEETKLLQNGQSLTDASTCPLGCAPSVTEPYTILSMCCRRRSVQLRPSRSYIRPYLLCVLTKLACSESLLTEKSMYQRSCKREFESETLESLKHQLIQVSGSTAT
ncbi:uncharacterized protein ARMOST_15171 [Armillaria ostoyae]|uniref:Uncharacterized protein n=1 Tax=Armillaria ostoyae TaxID=47428 RepID=A0A284RSM1_ARMOS|nr:uncharacterized protein ARMOST_15171 [Armillaria ostoyae]